MQTTDNQEEVFDIVDKSDKVIGQAKRSEVHQKKNLIHRSVAVAVVNSNNKIFLQRRSITKDTDALKWTISCSGHVPANESYEQAARRELDEELKITRVNLNYLTKYLYESLQETEMTVLYKAQYDGPITINIEEILEGNFFNREELVRAYQTGKLEINLYGKLALEKLGWLKSN